jgi:hypothetical protein
VCSFDVARGDAIEEHDAGRYAQEGGGGGGSEGNDDDSGRPVYISPFQACINDCSGHGNCQVLAKGALHVLEGSCSCDMGWGGADCSHESTQILKTVS